MMHCVLLHQDCHCVRAPAGHGQIKSVLQDAAVTSHTVMRRLCYRGRNVIMCKVYKVGAVIYEDGYTPINWATDGRLRRAAVLVCDMLGCIL